MAYFFPYVGRKSATHPFQRMKMMALINIPRALVYWILAFSILPTRGVIKTNHFL
jgi:hypothetical protein